VPSGPAAAGRYSGRSQPHSDHSLDCALRHSDGTARSTCSRGSIRHGYRHPRHWRSACRTGAISVFIIAGRCQYDRRTWARIPGRSRRGTRDGLTNRQILTDIELILAFPVILTGNPHCPRAEHRACNRRRAHRGRRLGVFVFQGINQTAIDLVLLGAPADRRVGFSCAVLLDALVERSIGPPR